MRKLLPLLFLLAGLAGGVGAGLALRPGSAACPPDAACDGGAAPETPEASGAHDGERGAHDPAGEDYIELNNQFIIPVVAGDMVEALVVLSLGVAVDPGGAELVYQREPKLRDAFLQVLFDHANMGGFRGKFTDSRNMDVLRTALTEAAQGVLGTDAGGVVITGIARQDI